MNDSFEQGDVLLVECDTSDIDRFDVVVAYAMNQKVIKRVIGLPGETIQIKNKKVFINGEEVEGEFAFLTYDAGIAGEPYVLGEDEYFLMGDNRSRSADSRVCGGVKIENIRGVVTFRLYPFDAFGSVADN